MKRAGRWLAGIGLVAAALVIGAFAPAARGQAVDVESPRALVVGAPPGARTARVDAARTGLSRTALPASGLHVAWRASAGAPLDDAPLVDAHGVTYVVGAHGDVVAFSEEGTERWRAATGASDPGPPVLLADDSVAFVDATGAAVAVRDGAARWRTRIGAADAVRPAPLPLGNGGAVVATSRDLVQLDADGHERARAVLPEACASPLLSALGKVIAVSASGTAWGWAPGATEASRLGSFAAAPAGGAALADDHTLVAVVGGGSALAALDLRTGSSTVRAVAAVGAVASAGVWLGPPAMRGDVASLILLGPASELAVAVDGAGREVSRALLTGRSGAQRADAGVAPGQVAAAAYRPLLVDGAGTLVFGTLDGGLGSVSASAEGSVEVLADSCPRIGSLAATPTGAPLVAGLAPLRAGAFVATCRSGAVLAVTGAGSGTPRPTAL